MKKIEAIIRREKLDAVKKALDAIKTPGITMYEVLGHGKQKGIVEQFRGREFRVDFLPKTKIEVVVEDSHLRSTLDAILKAAATGQVGDGKIFVSTIDDVIRVRTGESGALAVA